MKTTLGLLACLLLAAAPAGAALEPVKLNPDSPLPWVPASLQLDAFSHGRVVLVVDISADGLPTDWLVLGYTHRPLVTTCLAVLPSWRFTPARLDGTPVPVQVEFSIEFSPDGAVLTTCSLDEMFIRERFGEGRHLITATTRPADLDRVPARVTGPAPKYAAAAERQGVRGKVEVRFYIDETGAVRMPSVDAGSQPYLAGRALEAVRNWKFEPPMSKGRPALIAASEEFDFGRTQ